MKFGKKSKLIMLAIFLYGTLAFFYGFFVNSHHIPPYSILNKIYNRVHKTLFYKPECTEKRALNAIFTVELLTESKQLYPPCKNLEDVVKRVHEYCFDVNKFDSAYRLIKIVDVLANKDYIELIYKIDERRYSAFTYYISQNNENEKSTIASLIIPGSGQNRATKLVKYKDNDMEKNIIPITNKFSDSYVSVLPNHDFIAIHDGKNRLSLDGYKSFLLNEGYSFSALYIVNSLAFMKYLKMNYKKVFIFGISQGGLAALLNAIQSEPDAAIISSGFSVFFDRFNYANFGQIIIPGYFNEFNKKIYNIIDKQKTQYLFTFGLNEGPFYGLDAENKWTKTYFQQLRNVKVVNHSGGHCYPKDVIESFLNHFMD